MDKKQFLVNFTIQIEASDENEAKKILLSKKTIEIISQAIAENLENIDELDVNLTSDLLN